MSDSPKKKPALYQAVYENLVRAIERREYMPGSRFWSLSELCVLYHISEITARRVLRELTSAGYIYCEKRHRSIVTGRCQPRLKEFHVAIIGELTHPGDDIQLGPWTYHMQQSIMLEMLAQRLVPQICEMRDYNSAELDLMDCDAVLAMNSADDCYEKLQQSGKPFIMLKRNSISPMQNNTISLDFLPACRKIAHYMLNSGIRSFLSITHPVEKVSHRYACGDLRFEPLYDALQASGRIAAGDLQLEICPWTDRNKILQDLIKRFLSENHPRPYGFMAGDIMAREICTLCRIAGLIPGEDFRIAALSGLPGTNVLGPQLSSMVFPFCNIARQCSEYFRNVLDGKTEPVFAPRKVAVDFEVNEF